MQQHANGLGGVGRGLRLFPVGREDARGEPFTRPLALLKHAHTHAHDLTRTVNADAIYPPLWAEDGSL
eukprot:5695493-Alexandrium_andersonii.AAC.1